MEKKKREFKHSMSALHDAVHGSLRTSVEYNSLGRRFVEQLVQK